MTILRTALEGEIPKEEIENNIAYYKEYIEDSPLSEKETIKELGNPRLIARSIITSYLASKGPMAHYYKEQAREEYSQFQKDEAEQKSQTEHLFGSGRFPGWAYKLFGILTGIATLVILFVLLTVLLQLALYLVIPIVCIVLLFRFFLYMRR